MLKSVYGIGSVVLPKFSTFNFAFYVNQESRELKVHSAPPPPPYDYVQD